ncbi:MAG: excinuclease ABC subunit UvrC [Bacteroidia bacterium]
MSEAHSEKVREQLRLVPDAPGVYRYYNKSGQLLYIGKAKSLLKRVRSYFSGGKGHSYRIATMVAQIADIQYTITHSESEALTLENNFIKEHQPKYNINLKDGKTYPYITITKERFPRVFPTRDRTDEGAEYYGPFTSVKSMHAFLDLIRQNYKYRTCNYNLSEANVRSGKFKLCLEYQIGNCLGPCEAQISEEDYLKNIASIRKILKGHLRELLEQLEQEMYAHAEEYAFEKAEAVRIMIEKIRAFKLRNTVVSEEIDAVDVLTVDRLNDLAVLNHFRVSRGAIVATHSWEVRIKNDETDEELLASVFDRLLVEEGMGKELLTNVTFGLEDESADWEGQIKVPTRGDRKMLVDLSMKNCRVLLEEKVWKQTFKKKSPQEPILEQLQKDLHLTALPKHIECFDNSNFHGTNPVASMVVFKDGKASKKDYRHFKIKTVEGPNDFASMEEIIHRRYKRCLDENLPLPNLIIVDGGKGQLSSAAKSLEELGLITKVPIIGIAKKLEEIYVLNDPIPLHLDKRSTSLKLIQQLRNEAHRFGITFHRDLRSKNTFVTHLTDLPGVGKGTADKLLQHFRSVKKVKEANLDELIAVIGQSRAALIKKAIEEGAI